MAKVIVSCPGTCGELIQGYVEDEFRLVSCGINMFSVATITSDQGAVNQAGEKSRKALEATLADLEISSEDEVKLSISSSLSVSKGMASSTADMAASIYAASLYYKKPMTLEKIAGICTSIEATDSSFFNSLTMFDSRGANFIEQTGWQPNFYVLMLEPKEELNTEAFHTKANDELLKKQAKSFSRVHNLYRVAVKEKSLEKLGQAALKSAKLNQEILPKPFFETIVELSGTFNSCIGVNVAHSGTVIGILLRDLTEVETIKRVLEDKQVTTYYQKLKVYSSCYKGLQQQKGG